MENLLETFVHLKNAENIKNAKTQKRKKGKKGKKSKICKKIKSKFFATNQLESGLLISSIGNIFQNIQFKKM